LNGEARGWRRRVEPLVYGDLRVRRDGSALARELARLPAGELCLSASASRGATTSFPRFGCRLLRARREPRRRRRTPGEHL